MKKSLACLLLFALCAAALPSLAEQPTLPTLTTFPITQDKTDLTMAVWQHTVHGDFGEMLMFQKYEALSNVHINWIHIPMANFNEKRNIMFATRDLPDAFFKARLTMSDLTKYASEGLIIPLNDLIDQYAPNVKAFYEKRPNIPKALTLLDGQMYSLPNVSDHSALQVNEYIYLNRAWLENLNLSMPTTTDEFLNVLRAFRDNDANQNGDPNDEICYSGYTSGIAPLINGLKGSWGLGNRGGTHEYVDIDEATGELRFQPTTDAYREVLTFVRTLYEEKLIDQEIFTNTYETFLAKTINNQVGAMMAINRQFAAQYSGNYEGIHQALTGPYGDEIYAYTRSQILQPGAFVITSECKDPVTAMKWVDYFYSEAGAELMYLTEKGLLYDTDENGNNYYLEMVTNDPQGRTMGQVIGQYNCWGGGSSPVLIMDNYYIGDFTDPTAAAYIRPYCPTIHWENFIYTEEENEQYVSLSNDIIGYVKEMAAQFVTGRASLEKDWEDYVNTLNQMRLDDFMALYATGYARYQAQ